MDLISRKTKDVSNAKYLQLETSIQKIKQYPLTYIIEKVRSVVGFAVRIESDFEPRKNNKTVIINIHWHFAEDDFREYRLVLTGNKWFDKYTKAGGIDAISLFQYMTDMDFTKTVNWLFKVLENNAGKVIDLYSKREPVTKLEVIYDVNVLGWLPKCDMPSMEFPFFLILRVRNITTQNLI